MSALDWAFISAVMFGVSILATALLIAIASMEVWSEQAQSLQWQIIPIAPTSPRDPPLAPMPIVDENGRPLVEVRICFVRDTGSRKYRDYRGCHHLKSSLQLFDVVMDEIVRKRRRVRAKGWKIELRSAGVKSISIDATNDEIDEFCGLYWEEISQRP